MTLKEIADELVAGCREGRELANLDRLYAPDALSVEAMGFGGMDPVSHGIDAIKGKHAWWSGAFEFLGGDIGGPYLHGDDRFAVTFTMKTRDRATGAVSEGAEVAVYHVKGGKIVREEFFYAM